MSLNILLIDFEEDVRVGAAEVIKMYGADCRGVSSVKEAEPFFDKVDIVISAIDNDTLPNNSDKFKLIKKPYTAKELLDLVFGRSINGIS